MAFTKKRKPNPNSGDRKTSTNKDSSRRKTTGDRKSKKSTGPRLPSALRKQLDIITNPNFDDSDNDLDVNGISGEDEEIDSDEGEVVKKSDLYEYEEEVAEEESKKNKRYDRVDNFEYQLPDKFKDEDVLSDDDDDDNDDDGDDDAEYDKDSDDDGRHARMLHNITGIPSEAFEGRKRKRNPIISEVYPESEFNPTRDVLSGDGQISIEDLLGPIRGPSGSKIRKRIERMEKKGLAIQVPLPKPERERVEREAAYDHTKKDITKWEPLIKRNREASTLYFNNRNEFKPPTVGTIASEFTPRTEFEKTITSLMQDDEIMEAYKNDGAKLLELSKVSVEDVKERQDKLAKMRSLLFRHETKAKHIKKIKSKTYHRLKKRDRLKTASLDPQSDPEVAKERAKKQEQQRAVARMTQRHKNQGKWAKRVLERGLDRQDEGTRAAISEQLHLHNQLTRRMNSVKGSSSSDDSSSEDDEDMNSSDDDRASKLIAKAKEKTLKVMEQEDEAPASGVSALPFMLRGLEKRKEAANEEARRALEEYELTLNQQDNTAAKGSKHGTVSGRMVFGTIQKKVDEPKIKRRPEVDNYGSENEDIVEENDDVHVGHGEGSLLQKDVNIDLDVLREDLETGCESKLEGISDLVVVEPGTRTAYDVSVFTSGSWKKGPQNSRDVSANRGKDRGPPTFDGKAMNAAEPSLKNDVQEEMDDDSDSDSGGQMIDGMLSSGTKQAYKLPSNEELIKHAFAGDDVVEEFQKAKDDVLNEENPEPEKPLLLPGWGQWTGVQKKKGLPSWMLKEHADAKRKREEALKKRKDAHLKHVIISEKVDKKAEKLYSKTLPYPFTSKEVFEQSIRMPIGPEFNPTTAAGALIRPEVVKESGIIINPIKFQEVDPHEREEQKQGGRKRKAKGKSSGQKMTKSKRT